VTTTVQVTFSRAVQPSSIDGSSFGMRQADGTNVPVVYGFSNGNRDVSMTPISELPPSTGFELFTTTDILDSNGDALTNPSVTTFTTQAPPALTLSALSPPAATVGTQVVVSGTGFAAVPADNTVHFGAASAVATSAGPGYVIAYVPLGATSGNLTVEANSQTSNALTFTVLVPETAPLDEIVSTVDTGISVQSVAVTPDGTKAYTVSTETNEVLPVDLATFTNLPAIAVGSGPKGIVIHPNGQTAYVTNFGSGTVSVIDVASDAVVATITVGANPVELVASPLGDRLYVVNSLDQTLSVIDIDATSATYHTVVSSSPTTKSTKGAAITPDGSLLILGTSDGYIAIDLGATSFGVVSSYSTGKSTKGAAITPDGSLLLLVTTLNEVLILDISAGPSDGVVSSYSTGKNTKGAAITPDGSLLYILQEDSDEILVVELIISSSVSSSVVLTPIVVTTKVVKTIPVDPEPAVVAFDPSGSGLAIVGHQNSGGQLTFLNVSSIPFGQLEATVEVNPSTLNLGSRGRYVTGIVELPAGVFVENIDLSTVKLNDLIPPEIDKSEFIDRNQDSINELSLKFDRKAVQEALPQGDYVPVWINGLMNDGRSFAGDDTIRTIRPQVTHPAGNEAFYPGQNIMVTWASPEGVDVACVDLFWSPDDGATWMEVAVGIEDAGAYGWTVPDLYTDLALMEVTIYDSCDGTHQHGDDVIGVGLSQDTFFIMDQAVPVVMQSMDLGIHDGAGRLEWSVADPQSVEGFHVFRSDSENGEYARVSDLPVTAVSTKDGVKFVFEDDSIFANRDYFYMLQEDRQVGKGFDHGPFRLNWALDNALYQNRPNSFNPRTTISFSIAKDGRTRLAVYNLAGRLVDVIVDEVLRADTHEYTWDGKDRSGRSVASGVYVYRLQAPDGFVAAKKMTLVR
jgi:YVTN family beta-propeller protein